jgi:hypothetical protein
LGSVQHIALDLLARQICWTDVIVDTIRRANLDGTGVIDLITGLDDPVAIALDIDGSQMYWADFVSGSPSTRTIMRANLDGTGVTTLITDLKDVPDLALDTSLPEPCTINIQPDTLNKKSKGKYVTCYIELPEGYSADDIDIETAILTVNVTSIGAELSPVDIGGYNNNDILDCMVKFDRESIQDACNAGAVEFTLSCETYEGTLFEGTDTVLVLDKGQEHFSEDHGSVVY